ncbi:Lrp/AsnC family transcriptional regulator [Amycolatopsis halotolerans]|uniref:Lrp/AsnC family transcriptional regulator n=1 Tax=Amycolatopsis halotolerans TaxID=330083 RepID=A0ABV7QUD7_9PSEU
MSYVEMMGSLVLDELDRQLVHALQIDGRASFSQVAKVLGTSDQTVARRYRRLRSARAMRVLGLPNVRRFGHVERLLRVRCTPDAAGAVAAALARRDDTSWVSLTAGGAEIVCMTHALPRGEGEALLLRKLPRTPRVVGISAHHLLHTFSGGPTGWPGKSAALAPEQVAHLRAPGPDGSGPGAALALSDNDLRLLGALALDGRAAYLELAAATGWSESTTKRRLEFLRRSGALFFDVEIDAALLGFEIEAMLWMSVPPSDLEETATSLTQHREVAFAAAITGPANLVAFVACENTEAFYTYLTEGIASLRAVTRLETAPVIHSVKRAGALLDAQQFSKAYRGQDLGTD